MTGRISNPLNRAKWNKYMCRNLRFIAILVAIVIFITAYARNKDKRIKKEGNGANYCL
jgi:hypothetical protein